MKPLTHNRSKTLRNWITSRSSRKAPTSAPAPAQEKTAPTPAPAPIDVVEVEPTPEPAKPLGFTVLVDELKHQLKGKHRRGYAQIMDVVFPVGALQDFSKVTDSPILRCELDREYQNPIRSITTETGRGKKKKIVKRYTAVIQKYETTPAIIIRHGSTKTVMLGKFADQVEASAENITALDVKQ